MTSSFTVTNFEQNNIFSKIQKVPNTPWIVPKATREILKGALKPVDTHQWKYIKAKTIAKTKERMKEEYKLSI